MKKLNNMVVMLLTAFLLFLNKHCDGAETQVSDVVKKVKWQEGPCSSNLGNLAEIRIPGGYVFAGKEDTSKLMEAIGNISSNEEQGFFAPQDLSWFIVFEFSDTGYIKDDEKNSLDADAMLSSIQNATNKSNQQRKERGFGGLQVLGWEIKPQYNEQTHNLEWAIRAQGDDKEIVLNHNTRLLGRTGVMKATLVVNKDQFASVLPIFKERLQGFNFKSGFKYSEFRVGDKLAKYGLAALVVGGSAAAAAKLGLFKYIWKLLVVIAVFFTALFKNFVGKIKGLFRRKDQ